MDHQEVIEQCLNHFKQGTLTEEGLKEYLLQTTGNDNRLQSILYLFCSGSSLNSSVIGMAIAQNGELSDGPEDANDWPYKSAIEAVKDGWRIIHFPRVAQSSSDIQEYVPNEFILEKMEAAR